MTASGVHVPPKGLNHGSSGVNGETLVPLKEGPEVIFGTSGDFGDDRLSAIAWLAFKNVTPLNSVADSELKTRIEVDQSSSRSSFVGRPVIGISWRYMSPSIVLSEATVSGDGSAEMRPSSMGQGLRCTTLPFEVTASISKKSVFRHGKVDASTSIAVAAIDTLRSTQ
jgi:hypothetical protein